MLLAVNTWYSASTDIPSSDLTYGISFVGRKPNFFLNYYYFNQ